MPVMERHIKLAKKLQIQVKNQQYHRKIRSNQMRTQHSRVEVTMEMIREITLIQEAMQV